jgi:DNA-binding transcriptional LysR family regulator
LATKLFNANGAAPVRHVEADHEAVISSLVTAGVGVALMREDIAEGLAASGQVFVWDDARLATTLQFLYRRDRERDAPIHALRDVVRDVWKAGEGAASKPRRNRPSVTA